MNLVFASGFLVPQSIAGQEYFRGLKSHYPDARFPKVNTIGSIADRAAQLASQIDNFFKQGPIHVIAHSMGGLDTRYLLAHNLNGLAGRIASLSTISTPHGGSPIADALTGEQIPLVGPLATRLLAGFLDAFPGLKANTGALADLTTASARKFTQANPPTPGVQYFAYAAKGPVAAFLAPFQEFIRLAGEGDNDGVVSVASATWPGALAEATWPTDHFGEVGYTLGNPAFAYLDAYARVVARATGT